MPQQQQLQFIPSTTSFHPPPSECHVHASPEVSSSSSSKPQQQLSVIEEQQRLGNEETSLLELVTQSIVGTPHPPLPSSVGGDTDGLNEEAAVVASVARIADREDISSRRKKTAPQRWPSCASGPVEKVKLEDPQVSADPAEKGQDKDSRSSGQRQVRNYLSGREESFPTLDARVKGIAKDNNNKTYEEVHTILLAENASSLSHRHSLMSLSDIPVDHCGLYLVSIPQSLCSAPTPVACGPGRQKFSTIWKQFRKGAQLPPDHVVQLYFHRCRMDSDRVLGRRREYFFLLHPKDVKENQIGLCMVYPINEKRKESKILSMSDGRSVKVEEDHSGRPLISSPTAQERKRERPVEDDEVDGGYLAVESGAKCLEKIKDPLSPGGGRARNGRVSPSKSANNVSSPPRKRGAPSGFEEPSMPAKMQKRFTPAFFPRLTESLEGRDEDMKACLQFIRERSHMPLGGNETIVVALSGDDGAGKTAMACSLACQAAEMLQISPQRRIYVNMLDISRPNNDLQDWHAMLLIMDQLDNTDLFRTGDFSRDEGGAARMLFEDFMFPKHPSQRAVLVLDDVVCAEKISRLLQPRNQGIGHESIMRPGLQYPAVVILTSRSPLDLHKPEFSQLCAMQKSLSNLKINDFYNVIRSSVSCPVSKLRTLKVDKVARSIKRAFKGNLLHSLVFLGHLESMIELGKFQDYSSAFEAVGKKYLLQSGEEWVKIVVDLLSPHETQVLRCMVLSRGSLHFPLVVLRRLLPDLSEEEVYSAVHSLAKRHIVTLWEEELPVLNNYIRRFVDRAGAFPSLPLTCSRDALLQFCESEAGAVSNLSSTVESIAAKAGSASSGYESDASDTTVHGRFRKFHHLPASEEHMHLALKPSKPLELCCLSHSLANQFAKLLLSPDQEEALESQFIMIFAEYIRNLDFAYFHSSCSNWATLAFSSFRKCFQFWQVLLISRANSEQPTDVVLHLLDGVEFVAHRFGDINLCTAVLKLLALFLKEHPQSGVGDSEDACPVLVRAKIMQCIIFLSRHVGEFSKASSVAKELDHFLKTSPELSFERDQDVPFEVINLHITVATNYLDVGAPSMSQETCNRYQGVLEERHKRGRIPAQETLCYARLLSTLAISLDMQSKYKEAAVVCKQAIKIRELLGTQNPSFVKTLILAANIQKDRGRYYEAHSFYQKVLVLWKEVFCCSLIEYCSLQCNIASLKKSLGEFADAEALYRKALGRFERIHGVSSRSFLLLGKEDNALENSVMSLPTNTLALRTKSHSEIARCCINLGIILELQGRMDEVGEMYQRAYQFFRTFSEKFKVDYASVLDNYGVYAQVNGYYAEAFKVQQEAYEIRQDLFQNLHHPELITSLNNLGIAKDALGMYSEASVLLLQSLEHRIHTFGKSDTRTARSMTNFAICLARKGNFGKAAELLYTAVAIHNRVFGQGWAAGHHENGVSLNNLGIITYLTQQFSLSWAHFLEAKEVLKRKRGIMSLATLVVECNCAILMEKQDLETALKLQIHGCEAQRHARKRKSDQVRRKETLHPLYSVALFNAGRILVKLGRNAEAKKCFKKSDKEHAVGPWLQQSKVIQEIREEKDWDRLLSMEDQLVPAFVYLYSYARWTRRCGEESLWQ